jgi:hypothetical protein
LTFKEERENRAVSEAEKSPEKRRRIARTKTSVTIRPTADDKTI